MTQIWPLRFEVSFITYCISKGVDLKVADICSIFAELYICNHMSKSPYLKPPIIWKTNSIPLNFERERIERSLKAIWWVVCNRTVAASCNSVTVTVLWVARACCVVSCSANCQKLAAQKARSTCGCHECRNTLGMRRSWPPRRTSVSCQVSMIHQVHFAGPVTEKWRKNARVKYLFTDIYVQLREY